METEKLPGYWPTRILLAVGVLIVGLELLLAPTILSSGFMDPMFDPRGSVLGVPAGVASYLLAVGVSLAGLARMIRVFRGSRDRLPSWRYRGR